MPRGAAIELRSLKGDAPRCPGVVGRELEGDAVRRLLARANAGDSLRSARVDSKDVSREVLRTDAMERGEAVERRSLSS